MKPHDSEHAARCGDLAQWVFLIACGIWAFTMFASGMAKLWNPWPAAAMNLRAGLGGHVLWVLLLASFEVATAWLLLRRRMRDQLGLLAAGGLAMTILFWRFTFAEEMANGCGCFGSVQVPGWLAWTTASVGFLGCSGSLAARLYRRGFHKRILVEAAAGGMLLFGASALVHLLAGQQLNEQGLAELALSQNSVLMIGAVDCPHCRDTLALVERTHPRAIASGRLRLVTKKEDPGIQGLPASLQGLSILQVAGPLWWKLVREGPPQFYLPRKQGLLHLDGRAALLQELGRTPSKPRD